jgi:glutamate-ammonia-ligase adenylyltransferase
MTDCARLPVISDFIANEYIMPRAHIKNDILQQQAEHYWQQFAEHPQAKELSPVSIDEIKYIFGLSQFVADYSIKYPLAFIHILTKKWHQHCDLEQECTAFNEHLNTIDDENKLHQYLREFRNQHMVAIAWRDLSAQQSIETSLQQVSALADTLILGAYHWLYHKLCEQYGTPMGQHGPQPMFILGMGKLGGGELNFSSDIDLIFAYPSKGETQGKRRPLEHQQFFTKLAQKLIAALNKVTPAGQVFRVDMRLRPFGDSGPLVAHFSALEDYYQEQGRQWERYAMIKARVLNPPSPYQSTLDKILHPFIYRRYLDFTTLDAIREMKSLIAKELRRRKLQNNIKLGAGGIREIEFFAQSFQLIHGGREPSLQHKSLLKVLDQLDSLNLVDSHEVAELRADYFYLRKTEHTLQQMGDKQTQMLPEDPWQQEVLVEVMGAPDWDTFMTTINTVMARVHNHFSILLAEGNDDTTIENDTLLARCHDAWQIGLDADEFLPLLSPPLDADNAEKMYQQLNDFRAHIRQSLLGPRGETTLNKLIPEVIYHLVQQCPEYSNTVFSRILNVIQAITGRTTYLDLLHENPSVLRQLIKLCARSAWISEQIRSFPLLLDELLTPYYLQQQQTDIGLSYEQYQDELRQQMLRVEPEDIELSMEQWRQFKLCQQLRIAASDISGSLPIAKVSDKLTVLAEVLLKAVFDSAWLQITARYGQPEHLARENKGFAIIGYGKLGGIELGYGSDLDLVFLHNAPREANTTGSKSISATQFYIKLAQRIMHLLNTKTLSGQLYETDLRLRPSGNAGLLCCGISGYEHYQQNEAWTWEHQALVRARPILGDIELTDEFHRIRNTILCLPRQTEKLRAEVKSMREKMRQHLLNTSATGIDLKQCEGGITDIEFMTQYWVLSEAANHPEFTQWTDNLRLIQTAAKVGLISTEDAAVLQDAYLMLRDKYHQLTLAGQKLTEKSKELAEIMDKVSARWLALFG